MKKKKENVEIRRKRRQKTILKITKDKTEKEMKHKKKERKKTNRRIIFFFFFFQFQITERPTYPTFQSGTRGGLDHIRRVNADIEAQHQGHTDGLHLRETTQIETYNQ